MQINDKSQEPYVLIFVYILIAKIISIITFFKFYLFILDRESKRERDQFVVPLIYAIIVCFLYVPLPEINPATLVH